MSSNPRYELVNPVVGSIDSNAGSSTITQSADQQTEMTSLVRQLIQIQNRQNALLTEVINQLSLAQRQRNMELAQWKRANPGLALMCKTAADRLGKIQTEFLAGLADEVADSYEDLQDSEYLLNEFFDKYGPRIVHLNTLLQTLATLGNAPDVTQTASNS